MVRMSGGEQAHRAAIVAVGSELLTPSRTDTNSLAITGALNAIGIEVAFKAIVGDDRLELAAMCRQAMARASLVIFTGGLGPTDDDLTREVVADVLARELREDPGILAAIRARFDRRGLRMPETNRRQAQVPAGAEVLANDHGTAPGLWIDTGTHGLLLLPGPPREMRPMLARAAERFIAPRWGGRHLRSRELRIAGRTESRVEELAQPLYSRWLAATPPIETTILASPGVIELHLSVRSSDEAAADAALRAAVSELSERFGHDVVSDDGRSLEQVVGDELQARRCRIALAESCTGGLASSRLTDAPGSSAYVDRSVVVYSNQAKVDLLGVPAPLLREHGAVSEPVAAAMAEGVRARAGVEVGVGITGIAGPGGGSVEKPVGMVVIAVAGPQGTEVRTFRFVGGRATIKVFAAGTAFDMVRRYLIGADLDVDWLFRPPL
jgi:nicotinamide-nucleotide amidase